MRIRRSMIAVVSSLALLALDAVASSARDEPPLLWSRSAGTALLDVAVRGSDSFVAGTRRIRGIDALLVQRYGGSGHLIWSRSWRPRPRSAQDDPWAEGRAIAAGSDGSIYVAGAAAYGCASDDGSWFLRKYASGGRLLWHRAARQPDGCGRTESSSIDDLAVGDGALVAALNVCGGDYCDGGIAVFSGSGRSRMTIPFEPFGPPTSTADGVGGVDVGSGGTIFAAGGVAMRTGFDPSPDHEIAVSAYRPSGSLRWSRILRDTGARDVDGADAVAVAGGLVAVAGHEQRPGCRSSPNRFRLCPVLVAFNTAGVVEWRWRGGQQAPGGAAGVVVQGASPITASWTSETRGTSAQHVLVVRLERRGMLRWAGVVTPGVSEGLSATNDRMSIVGARRPFRERGTLWRFAFPA